MTYDEVLNCMKKLVDMENIVISSYHSLPYGLKIIDQRGDYAIFFYDTNTNQVIYFFKDTEDFLFRYDIRIGY